MGGKYKNKSSRNRAFVCEVDSSDTLKWWAFVNTIMNIRFTDDSKESFPELAQATQVL
jgi:hypothetical protein